MKRSTMPWLPILLAAIAWAVPAWAQKSTSGHEQCQIDIDARGVAWCSIPSARAALVCDRSVGQPRPQCITAEGWPADCTYRRVGSDELASIFCSVEGLPPAEADGRKRIVITDADFGGARQVVRVPKGVSVQALAPPRLPAAPGRPASAVPVGDLYKAALQECDEARNKVISAGVQSNSAREVVWMVPLLRRSCTGPVAVRSDPGYGKSWCDAVTTTMNSVAVQFPGSESWLRGATRAIVVDACSR